MAELLPSSSLRVSVNGPATLKSTVLSFEPAPPLRVMVLASILTSILPVATIIIFLVLLVEQAAKKIPIIVINPMLRSIHICFKLKNKGVAAI